MSIDVWVCVTAGPLARSAHGKFPANADHIYNDGEKAEETRATVVYSESAKFVLSVSNKHIRFFLSTCL